MGKLSSIQWTDGTHNFWEGCNKVSEGCKYCYAERMFTRWNKPFTTVRRIKNFDAPLKWKKGQMIFVCNTSDFFHPAADPWRQQAWDIIRNTPQHTYQVLTKRTERILQCLPADWGDGYANVWIGASVENQKQATIRIPELACVKTVCRWISAEPLLEPIDLSVYFRFKSLDWVVVGGESGNNSGKHRHRICQVDWIISIMNDCRNAGIPVFVKQLGTHLSNKLNLQDWSGSDMKEWRKKLQVREFPVFIKDKILY